MNSLERRLTGFLLLSLVLLLSLLWFLGNATVRTLTEDFIGSRLGHDAETLLAGIDLTGAEPVLPGASVDSVYHRVFSGHYFIIQSDLGAIHSRSWWDYSLPVEPLPRGTVKISHQQGPLNQHLLVWTGGFEKQGHRLTLLIAEDLSPLAGSLWRFNLWFGIWVAVVLLLLLAAQRLIIRHGFRPLDRVTAAVTRLETGEISQLPNSVPSEVQPLVAEVNRLLGVMARRLERSRNAVGNLAHALKGPLSVLTRTAEAQGSRAIGEPVQRIREIVDHELRRARIAGTAVPGRRFRPAQELPTVIELLKRVYPEKALTFRCDVSPNLELGYDRDDMLELLGNLLDNACKWAGSTVNCGIEPRRFVIEDDGPGCPEEELARLTERGVRIDEQTPGHGLGLSIVRDIAESYGGTVTFSRSDLGGLRVVVSLASST